MKGRRVEGEMVRSSKKRLKASKQFVQENSHELSNILPDSIQSKKPSVGPKGLIGPPCHGALAAGGKKNKKEVNHAKT